MRNDQRKEKGFTMAELLIVVAILAVLVSISIVVFIGQLEKSREATDIANVRSAYAAVMTAANGQGSKSSANVTNENGFIIATVELCQKEEGFQTKDVRIGDISAASGSEHWIGEPKPGGTCEVYYSEATGVVIDWDGGNLWKNFETKFNCWQGAKSVSQQTNSKAAFTKSLYMFSSWNPDSDNGLYELEGGTTYKYSLTYDPKRTGPYGILVNATLVYNSAGTCVMDTGTPAFSTTESTKKGNIGDAVTYHYTENADGTVTFYGQFKTPSADSTYYLGINFGNRNWSSASGSPSFSTVGINSAADLAVIVKQIQKSFRLEKAK